MKRPADPLEPKASRAASWVITSLVALILALAAASGWWVFSLTGRMHAVLGAVLLTAFGLATLIFAVIPAVIEGLCLSLRQWRDSRR